MFRRGRRVLALVGLGLLVVAVLGPGDQAFAHSFLVRTVPASGARLSAGPVELLLEFTEETSPVVVVRTVDGQRVDGLRSFRSEDPLVVRYGFASLSAGVYVVSWEGEADDGHRSEGSWAFAVGEVKGVSVPAASQRQAPASAASVGLTLLALLTLLGASVAQWAYAFGLSGGRATRRSFVLARLIGAVAAGVVVFRFAQLGRFESLIATAMNPSSKPLALAVTSACFGVAGVLLHRHRRLSMLSYGIAVVAVVAGGHSLVSGRWWVSVATIGHSVGGLWWLGSLAVVFVASSRSVELFARQLRRHSRTAVWVVPVAVAGGVATSAARLASASDLTASVYGRWVLAKGALICGALVLAWVARRRLILASGVGGVGGLKSWVGIEVVLVVCVVAVGAVLTAVAPSPKQALLDIGPSPVPEPSTTRAALSGNHQLVAFAGPNRLQIRLLAAGGQPPIASTRITVAGVEPDGTRVGWQPRRCGRGCIEVDHRWRDGVTDLTASVSNADDGNGQVVLSVAWPPNEAGSEALAVLQRFRAVPLVHAIESVDSGPASVVEPYPLDLPGAVIADQSPFPKRAVNATSVGDEMGGQFIEMWLPGSFTWIQLHVDRSGRLVDDLIVDPGHRVTRTYEYP